MKYFGFNPFIKVGSSDNNSVLYDFLSESQYIIDREIGEVFSSKIFKSEEEVNGILLKKYSISEIENIIMEGKKNGIIVETEKLYYREEVYSNVDSVLNSSSAIFFLKKIIVQPFGQCDLNCDICEKFSNCICQKSNHNWTKNNIDNFIDSLKKYKMLIDEIQIIGGNIFEYKELEYLLNKIQYFNETHIKIVTLFNINDSEKNFLKRIQCSSDKHKNISLIVQIPVLKGFVLKEMENLNLIRLNRNLKKIYKDVEFKFYFENMSEKLFRFFNSVNKKININWELLYSRKIQDLDKSKLDNVDLFCESVNIHEYSFRKNCHRCWGFSFAIDSSGIIKPCLWSNKELGKWEAGNIDSYIHSFENTYEFWITNSLKTHAFCMNCPLRYCCKHCYVVEEKNKDFYKKNCLLQKNL